MSVSIHVRRVKEAPAQCSPFQLTPMGIFSTQSDSTSEPISAWSMEYTRTRSPGNWEVHRFFPRNSCARRARVTQGVMLLRLVLKQAKPPLSFAHRLRGHDPCGSPGSWGDRRIQSVMFTSFGLLCSRRRGGPERPDYEFKVHGVNRATHRPVGVCRWL